MTTILFLGMVILMAMLVDTRKRLSALERRQQENQPANHRDPVAQSRRSTAVIKQPAEAMPATARSPWASPAGSPRPEDDAETDILSTTQPADQENAETDAAPSPDPMRPISTVQPSVDQPVMSEAIMPASAPISVPAQQEIDGEALAAEHAPDGAAPEAPIPALRQKASFSFEDLFGRKLPIWAGGITLLVAGVLLVKYSIDAGILSPAVRVILGLIFGTALIGGAEMARRRSDLVPDARISQSLAGAGVGSLYAATLAAANLYALIGPGTAFAGLALITGLAMALALRFGAPSAVLGLVGGLATPALIQAGPPNVPLLAGYIGIVVSSLSLLSRQQRWMWLGVSAMIGGVGWSLLMILMGMLDGMSIVSIGLLILLLGIALPVIVAAGPNMALVRGGAALIAAVQLALLVATGGFTALSWGLYGLLSVAFIWLIRQMPSLRPMIFVPLLTAILLVVFWPEPTLGLFSAVVAAIVLIYGGYAFYALWRADGNVLDARVITLTALAGYGLSHWHFHDATDVYDGLFAGLAIGFAALPALAAVMGWQKEGRRVDQRFVTLCCTTGLLLVIASYMGLPLWVLPVSVAAIAVLLLEIGRKAGDRWLPQSALTFFGMAVIALLSTGAYEIEMLRLAIDITQYDMAQAVLRWGALLAAAAVFAWRPVNQPVRVRQGVILQCIAAVLGYGLLAQIVPVAWLAIATAVALLAFGEGARKIALPALPAQASLGFILCLWALPTLLMWAGQAALSLTGEPMLASSLPELGAVLRHMLIPALIGGAMFWRLRADVPPYGRIVGMVQIGAFALVGVHILYKQLFMLNDMNAFVHYGIAERTIWQAALLAMGVIAWRVLGQHVAAAALIGTGLAHNLTYTMLLHNPLWDAQAVGTLPLANMLLPAFAIIFAAPVLLMRILPEHFATTPARRTVDGLRMVAILLFAYGTLRQFFTGSILVGMEIGPVENIGWSVLAISLAIGFLLWGIKQGLRDWRIASLLLMLVAVGKVFLFDASGLEGLLRILSFLALGFSLIGIGWLYSRYLRTDQADRVAG